MSGIVFALLGVAVAVILAGMGSAYGVGAVSYTHLRAHET